MIYVMGILFFSGTILLYILMRKLYFKLKYSMFMPIVTTSAIIVVLLLIFGISYPAYMMGGVWIDSWLGPAVVAMAYPLFIYWKTIKKYRVPILVGTLVGTIGGILTGLGLGILFNLNQTELMTMIPKSITSPIAKELSLSLGGTPVLTIVFVILAGIFGSVSGPLLLHLFRVTHPVGVGMAIGAGSHGIGTARAFEIGEEEGTISSVAMIFCAICASIVSPIILLILS